VGYVSGNLSWTFAMSGCNLSGTVTWNASK
jgi:hypothetical protein